jgi:putative GTP pyrophosphokinase
MRHELLEQRYHEERPIYEAWGEYVTDEIIRRLGQRWESMIRIPPAPRTKAVDSLIGKAYYRGKNYENPYEQITDKVGTRFVVLLLPHIRAVESVVRTCELWEASRDRDFEEERQQQPTHFTYQSVHYVVRAGAGVSDGSLTFPEGMPCEIQIRTLLQHAFSELTHDTVYKPQATRVPDVQRDLAKSMAMIEVTDDLFDTVNKTFADATAPLDEAVKVLERMYREVVEANPATNWPANTYMLDQLSDLWEGIDWSDVHHFASQQPVGRWVRDRYDDDFLYRQPLIMLIYYLAETAKINLWQRWPWLEDELTPVLDDLGEAPPYSSG